MNRRSFLSMLGAAPLAAMMPWRPPVMSGIDLACGDSYSVWMMTWNERRLSRIINPPIVVDKAGRFVRFVVLDEERR